ncbi:unnamed protein product, partial [marine sediment metagenome]
MEQVKDKRAARPRSTALLFDCSRLAEGNGRFTKADRRNFFTIARGSVP